jgi:hypothetical protein
MLKRIYKYFDRLGTAISVLLNVSIGGSSNQTLSARNYERKRRGLLNLCVLIDKLFWFEKDHCLMSWCYWRARKDVIHDIDFERKFNILENTKRY